MMLPKKALGVGLGAAIALTAGLTIEIQDAEARRGGQSVRRPHRGRHRFRTRAALAKPKTPATNSNGTSDTSGAAPVANGALEGGFRQDVVDGGALLVMSPDRALVLSSYKGLALIDTSDASSPKVLARLSTEGTAVRMFLGTNEVAVVADLYGPDGSTSQITSIAIGASSLASKGSVSVAGSLRDAARQGDDLLLVTCDSYSGPMPYMMAGDGMTAGPSAGSSAGMANGMRRTKANDASGAMLPGWGWTAKSHVARVRIGSDGAPSLLGTLDLDGNVLANVVSGTEAVLATQAADTYWYYAADASDPATGNGKPEPGNIPVIWTPPVISLVHVTDDAAGAPQTAGSLELTGVSGVWSLDRDGNTLRALEYTDAGEQLATFDVSGGAPVALDSIGIDGWPSATAFAGGSFVYGTTNWNYDISLPDKPVFDPAGADNALRGGMNAGMSGGMMGGTKGGNAAGTPWQPPQPTSALAVIDLRDPRNLVAGGSLDLGTGWLSTFTAVPDGIVGTLYGDGTGQGDGATTLFRIDVSNPASPRSTAKAGLTGYVSASQVLGDLLLVGGGTTNEKGSFLPVTRLVGLADGGLELGGSFESTSWMTAAARQGDLLGVAAFDRLTLVDVSDAGNPQVKGEARLLVNAAGFAALDADTGVVLATDYVGGRIEVRTVSLPAADPLNPLDVLQLGTGDAQMYAAAPYLYIVSTDWSTGRAALDVVDASDPRNLAARGHLDLASYPGQVFLKGDALLLLREVGSLFTQTEDGRMKAAADAFGNCPRRWLADELGAVLDVVDLTDPDTPRAGKRLRLDYDTAGAALLAGDSLFVPSYADVTKPTDEYPQYSYMVREIDVTHPTLPLAGRPVDVPGTLVAAGTASHTVLTTEYAYDETDGTTSSTLHVIDLSKTWRQRVLASAPLAGYPDTVTVGGDHVYVTTESWAGAVVMDQMMPGTKGIAAPQDDGFSANLVTLSLADLATESSLSRESGSYQGDVAGGCLFLRGWGWTGSLDVYSLAAPAAPAFLATHSVAGISGPLTVAGGRAYVAAGLYGVQVIDLSK